MGLVRLFVELVLTVVGSIVVLWLTGPMIYAVAGVVMMLVMLGLITTSNARLQTEGYDPLLEDHATPLYIRVIVGVVKTAMIGLFWPVLPVVIAWQRVSDRVDAGDRPIDTSRPSGPEGP